MEKLGSMKMNMHNFVFILFVLQINTVKGTSSNNDENITNEILVISNYRIKYFHSAILGLNYI